MSKGGSENSGGGRSTIILGIMGVLFTAGQLYLVNRKDNFDRETKRFEVISTLIEKCTSKKPENIEYINRIASTQLNSSFKINYINEYLGGNGAFTEALNSCVTIISNADATSTNDPQPSTPVNKSDRPDKQLPNTLPSAPPNDGVRNWIFLGTLKENEWKTRYTSYSAIDPQKYEQSTAPNGGRYKVNPATGALNVRRGVFGPDGGFPPIEGALRPGDEFTIRSTAQWLDSGNWWATIER